MSTALEVVQTPAAGLARPLPVPWRDPQTVEPALLAEHIRFLEAACAAHPESGDLRTCLGMAYAMNYEPYQSFNALETAMRLDPDHFFARFKFAELHYRLRALPRAEEETLRALQLASGAWEIALAKHQLSEIRTRMREGSQRPAFTKPLRAPLAALILILVLVTVVMACR